MHISCVQLLWININQEENMEKETAMECLDRIIDRLSDDQFGFLIGAIGYLKDYINSKE
jgi:hypothetical protein